MARKIKRTRKPSPAPEPRDRLIDATMALAGEIGWAGLTMSDIATAAAVPLTEALAIFPDKRRLLTAFTRRIDAAMLAGGGATDPAETPRDRLFDLVMRRFDALAPHKAAVRRIARDLGCDPLATLCQLGRAAGAMALTLQCAGIDSSGLAGRLRVKGLMVVYAAALKAWLDDDSPDQAGTMAALDRALMRAERFAGLLWRAPKTASNI